MLISWLLGPIGDVPVCGCARSPKALSCLRPRDCEGGDILEYSPYGQMQTAAAELLVEDHFLPGALPAGPAVRTLPTYATGQDGLPATSLKGEPLYGGDILRLSLGDSIHEAVMLIHVNGFSVEPRTPSSAAHAAPRASPQGICRLWSPFSLVEKCQVRAKQNEAQWAIFKMTIFRKEGQDASYYFAAAGEEAQKERDRWVAQIIQAISNLTLSLFPDFDISVDPVPGRVATSTRIMAGYLLQGGLADRASLVFCELHAYLGREARMALYRDEWCEQEVLSISISDSSIVSTRRGAYCTVFGINDQLFCARTEDERELWLRAVSNIKVKLMFDAPDPTAEELEVFRSAVHERVEALAPPLPLGGRAAAEASAAGARGAVLAEAPRVPPPGPRGDASADPEPVAEDACQSAPRRPLGGTPGAAVQALAGVAEEEKDVASRTGDGAARGGLPTKPGAGSMGACSGAAIEGL